MAGRETGKGFGDLSGGLAAAAEEIEDGAAGGIGEGLEGGFGSPGAEYVTERFRIMRNLTVTRVRVSRGKI